MSTQYTRICCLFIFLFSPLLLFPQQSFNLNKNFIISCADSSLSVEAQAPFNIKNILYKNGIINNPYHYIKSNTLEWVDNCQWSASMDFKLPQSQKASKSYLHLSGLNTYCNIYLNDNKLGYTDNAFRTYSFYIDPYLRSGTNTLRIEFLPINDELIQLTQMDKKVINNKSLLHRKSQIGNSLGIPTLTNTIGITGNISIDRWSDARISDRYLNTTFEDRKGIITEKLKVDLLSSGRQVVWERALFRPYLTRPLNVKRDTFTLRNETLESNLVEKQLNPWKINTSTNSFYGYKSTIYAGDKVIWSDSTSIAFRSIELKNENNQPQFVLNGHEEFIKGITILPFEMFQDKVNDNTYDYYFDLLQKSNVNLIRIPGFSSYVPEKFYEKCDSLGILIWHDFMFSSTIYPITDEYISNLTQEVQEVVKKAAKHPSIALWCGNNEVWKTLYESGLNTPLNRSDFIQYEQAYKRIFSDKLRSVVKKWDPDATYIETTPSSEASGEKSFMNASTYLATDDVNLNGKFITSIGFKALPAISSAKRNKFKSEAEEIEEIKNAISTTFGFNSSGMNSEKDRDYLSQLLQYIGINSVLTHCITSYPDKRGVIYSRFNDPFPLISSSIVDNGGYPKAGFYSLKHNYSSVGVFLQNNGNSLSPVLITPFREPINYNFTIEKWNTENNTLISVDSATVAKDLDSIYHFKEMFDIELDQENSLFKLKCDYLATSTYDFFLNRRWNKIDYNPVSVNIKQSFLEDGKFRLEITSDAIAYFTEIKASVAGTFSDNYFHLTPNSVKTITFTATNPDTELANFTTKTLNEVILKQE